MTYDEKEAHELAESMGMAVYHIYLLKKGPAWSPDSTPEISSLQEAHLANMRRLVFELHAWMVQKDILP